MSNDRTLVITRVLDAPRDMVFAAWVDPRQAAQWWGPEGFTTVSNRLDVRVGGAWRRHMRSPEGTDHVSRGIYREIAPPERLVFTFAWECGGAPGHGPETVVTLTFAERGDGRTELTLRQEGFATTAGRDEHRTGWSSCLERFAEYLAARRHRGGNPMQHQVVTREQWIEARRVLLAKEKEWTRLRDRLSEERRALPWVRIDKPYVFEGPRGKETLSDLFAGRSQLIVKHFMFGPGWTDPCVGCSFESDHIDGAVVHLEHHDVSFVAVSRAPYPEIAAAHKRMGWRFRWVSSFGSDFNYDFNVSFTPEQIASGRAVYNYREGAVPMDELSGRSVFYKDETGAIFHTYSAFARGGEVTLGTYALLDMTPKGRNETGRGNLSDWVRHHDRYETPGHVDAGGRWHAADEGDCCR